MIWTNLPVFMLNSIITFETSANYDLIMESSPLPAHIAFDMVVCLPFRSMPIPIKNFIIFKVTWFVRSAQDLLGELTCPFRQISFTLRPDARGMVLQ